MLKRMKEQLTAKETWHMNQLDWFILFLILTCYGIVSFINLGDMKAPVTFYDTQVNQPIVLELADMEYITTMRYFTGHVPGKYHISVSSDGVTYQEVKTTGDGSAFAWEDIGINQGCRYIKLVPLSQRSVIGEVQLYQTDGYPVHAQAVDADAQVLFDESGVVPDTISYMNSSYFDEIYFARTAYEYVHGLPAYEWVHPPLGKLIQAVPIRLMGMNPFSYRLAGNISGILMIGVMYVLGKNLFGKRKYAILAAGLMALDGFHFAQTRMGTIDSHLVLSILTSYLFMYQYMKLPAETPLMRKLIRLALSGIFISFAIAIKWTGLFAGLGLALLFFTHFYQHYLKGKKEWNHDATKVIGTCFLWFVFFPIVVYLGCYFLFPSVSSYHVTDLNELVRLTNGVYDYHATLKAKHPFSSVWYTWPLMVRPVWLYVGYYGNMRRTMSGFGNPLIWWSSLLGVVYSVIEWIRKKDRNSTFLLIAIMCMLIPYFKISRDMFLYHYFPVLPFVMLALVAFIKWLVDKTKKEIIYYVFFLAVFAVFLYFFPIVSGQLISDEAVTKMRWLSSWYF